MTRKITAVLLILVMVFALAACSEGEETTITGMVVSVDGTVLSLVEMSGDMTSNRPSGSGERPQMPGNMEGFGGFENFDPDAFSGTFPEGGDMPQWEGGERPEWSEDMTLPEGVTIPEDGQRPNFGGGERPGFGGMASDMETKTVDIGNAHISLQIDGGKAGGSMSDIKAGSMVTITMNGKGEVTNVLVSSSGFGGMGNIFGGNPQRS